jgi:adenylyltransferase/sulfurtransferase
MNRVRYMRQTLLKDFGAEGQQKLSKARVLVIGAGGLGVPVLTYLNAMGVGTLGIADQDEVSLSNLHRQVLYGEGDIGRSKVAVAIEKLAAQNPETRLIGHESYLTRENALDILSGYDAVVDASDNFPTRYLVNDTCVLLNKPLVYGALHGYEGQVSVFNYQGGPTYRCLFPVRPASDEVPNCNEHGVLGILPGIIGNLQALETVKLLTGLGKVLSGELLLFNGLDQSYQKIRFPVNKANLERNQLEADYGWEDFCEVVPSITATELQGMLGSNEEVQLIDVRTPEEFEQYSIPKSLNIPLDQFPEGANRINPERPVYLLCQSGQRSVTALKLLREQHKSAELFNVEGGIERFHALTH